MQPVNDADIFHLSDTEISDDENQSVLTLSQNHAMLPNNRTESIYKMLARSSKVTADKFLKMKAKLALDSDSDENSDEVKDYDDPEEE